MDFIATIKRLPITYWKTWMHIPFAAARELRKINKEYPQVASLNETLDKLIAGASIARFGDGEFGVCIGRTVNYSGKYDPKLQLRLLEVLHTPQTEKFLIGLPPYIPRQSAQNQSASNRAVEWFLIRTWRFLKKHIRDKRYENTFISRPDVFAEVPLEKWRRVWNDRDVIFIVPQNGRFVHDERVFSNIKSAQWLYVDPVDAFADYDHTLQQAAVCAADIEKPLFLIAAGQTATILAYDLCRQGFQAIDIGHLPNSYAAYLGEIKSPESLPKIRQK